MSFWEGFIQNVALGLTMEYRVHWNWQARINFFLRRRDGVVSPLPPPKIIFSRLKQNLRQFKKILTPILTISPKAKTKKSIRVCMKGWVAISNNKHVLIFYISTLFPTR